MCIQSFDKNKRQGRKPGFGEIQGRTGQGRRRIKSQKGIERHEAKRAVVAIGSGGGRLGTVSVQLNEHRSATAANFDPASRLPLCCGCRQGEGLCHKQGQRRQNRNQQRHRARTSGVCVDSRNWRMRLHKEGPLEFGPLLSITNRGIIDFGQVAILL